MANSTMNAPPLDAAQLRVLLTLARELFQSDEVNSSLLLVGRTVVDMIRSDSALLLLRGERLEIAAFDARGGLQPTGTEHPLYAAGMALMSDVDRPAAGNTQGHGLCEDVGMRTLTLAVPAHAAIAALAVAWDHDLPPAQLDGHKRTLSMILELAAAALGKIEACSSLERLVSNQSALIATTSVTHAAELAQRDEATSEMRMLSLIDVLTGLYNRRGFFVQAERLLKVSRRKRAKSAVIFADIDGLKRVNDDLGHDSGDGLIRDAGMVFRQSFRQTDVVARLGGDEFVAYTLDDEQPDVILERIRANLHAFNLMQEHSYDLSMSAGVVQCDPRGEQTLSDYVLLADEQMYVQKRSRLH
ncbi:diguanylate cyclase domain-containing protein [Massilia sp. CMS3.1]|uniref:GGDEF domain-containing protein n=1 Tax=Massilia sp. CMS3.1 TaxID=3373083 RepID=UPI003EE71E86